MDDARKNEELVSLASSQVLRWIDEFNGLTDTEKKAAEIREEITRLKRESNNVKNRHAINALYEDLDNVQFKKDYMCLIIDKKADYYRACKGFKINGVTYKRLLGTNGGIKNSTIVFVSDEHVDEIKRRIDNGRDPEKKLVTAKLEAYKALTCSASTPVSFPNGLLVVDDSETSFVSDIIHLTDEDSDEPIMTHKHDQDITIDSSDGFGIMTPTLAARWSDELGLDYIVSGVNTRFAFEKGMVFTFDILDFAKKVAGDSYIVKDAWGNDVDIRTVELILTTSMVKLWDSYSSCDDYVDTTLSNGYTFAVTKTCPKELENERSLNYQFIQSYNLNDEDIEELISPTIKEMKDVLGGDWRKTVLFLGGSGLDESNIPKLRDDFVKAIMIDHRMIDDPYIQSTVYRLIKKRINEAKVGVIKVHGNYSIASGDPYALCQSIFGLDVTGILKPGEIYNKYWVDSESDYLACFRAPMTCHNNIRKMKVNKTDTAEYWYRYMRTCTIFNAWDDSMAALNGMDFDGDLVMLTDNNVLVNRLEPLPALYCAQRRAEKSVSTEDDFIRSNIESFGNDIGATTNRITSMFEVRSHFPKDSYEYEVLSYRIRCGQLFQQNAIDKAKGIICKPMPRTWYDRHAANKLIDDPNTKHFYKSIVADKKPYFMRYIYPDLMKQYNTYIKNTNKNALREFQMTVDEMKATDESRLTEEQKTFIKYYDFKMPVGVGDCVMNKICRRFEEEFDGHIGKYNSTHSFDYSIMKSGVDYKSSHFRAIKDIYDEYNRRMQDYVILADREKMDKYEQESYFRIINDEFIRRCDSICQNEDELCDIILDMCYTRNSTKKFAWGMVSSAIIKNLLRNNDNFLSFPKQVDDGDIEYCGNMFTTIQVKIGDDED